MVSRWRLAVVAAPGLFNSGTEDPPETEWVTLQTASGAVTGAGATAQIPLLTRRPTRHTEAAWHVAYHRARTFSPPAADHALPPASRRPHPELVRHAAHYQQARQFASVA